MMTTQQIKDERAKLEARLDELDDIEQALDSYTPAQQLALTLHSSQCHLNHTDGCGWEYEVHKGVDDWGGSTHLRWEKKAAEAMRLLPAFTAEQIIEVARVLR